MAFVCGVGERKGECDWKSEEGREVEMSEASQPPKQITILWEKAPTLPNIQLKFALRYDLAHTAYMCLYMNMCKCIRWNYVCIWLYRCANGERRVWAIHTTQKHSTAIRRLSEKHTARVRERKRESERFATESCQMHTKWRMKCNTLIVRIFLGYVCVRALPSTQSSIIANILRDCLIDRNN